MSKILLFISLLLLNFSYAGHVENVIFGESGNNFKDAWYVAQVIHNRYEAGNYNSYYEVVTAPRQFDGYKKINKREILDSINCILHHVKYDNIPDSLRLPKGTMYFCNPKLISGKNKIWFNKLKLVKVSKFKNKNAVHHYYKKK